MTNNIQQAFYEAWGIYTQWIYRVEFNVAEDDCTYGGAYNIFVGKEDLLSWWKNVTWAFNKKITKVERVDILTPERILALEEIILHSKGNCDYQFKKDEGKYYCSCGELWNYRQGIGKTRSDALLSLLTQLKPELPEDFDYDNTDRESDCEYCSRCVFPTLTPERILALEEIVFKRYKKLDYTENYWTRAKGWIALDVGAFKGTSNILQSLLGWGKTRSDALLSLLTQLKPELSKEEQKQIRGVFE